MVGVRWELVSDCFDNTWRQSHSHMFANVLPAPAYKVSICCVAVTSTKNNRSNIGPRPWGCNQHKQQRSVDSKPVGMGLTSHYLACSLTPACTTPIPVAWAIDPWEVSVDVAVQAHMQCLPTYERMPWLSRHRWWLIKLATSQFTCKPQLPDCFSRPTQNILVTSQTLTTTGTHHCQYLG